MTKHQLDAAKQFAIDHGTDLLHTDIVYLGHRYTGPVLVQVYRKDSPIGTAKPEDLLGEKILR